MSNSIYEVALHYGEDEVGYLSYDIEDKTVKVVLPSSEWIQKVEDFLYQELTLANATDIASYDIVTIAPLASLENLKLALTRLWTTTDVQVDWTRAVELVK